jgi:ribosomal protein S27AE
VARRKRERLSAERWSEAAAPVWTGLVGWRAAHPKATLSEIEAELDRQVNQLRARVLGDLALATAAADVGAARVEARPRCARCGVVLRAQGQEERGVVTQGGVEVRLERSYATCPRCGDRSFPPGR